MPTIKLIAVLLLFGFAATASAKPKTAAEWEHCVTKQVPPEVERQEGRAGVQLWIDNNCGRTKPVSANGLDVKDCNRLVEILTECQQSSAEDIWWISEASRGNTKSLLSGKKLKQFDAECTRVGKHGGALPSPAAVKAKYCGSK